MTIIGAINKIDALKPNGYSQTEKVEWLSRIDGTIKKEIIDKHEGGDDIVFNGYDDSTPIDTKLIVEEPYDELYINWLESKIDYYNEEYDHYNATASKFVDAYNDFANDYIRTHMPKQVYARYY